MKRIVIGMTVVSLAMAMGCGKQQSEPVQVEAPKQFVSEKPAGTPVPIPDARALTPGSDVLLGGLVMGVKQPFVAGRGVFILGDTAVITPCGSDHCSTPWDACCDPIEARSMATATIQVLDEAGSVLAQGVKGANGLKELSVVTVKGTVAQNSTEEAFIVNASAIYVENGKPGA